MTAETKTLTELCEEHGVLALYLFGSRADQGMAALRGESVELPELPASPSARAAMRLPDLDVGVVFARGDYDPRVLSRLQVALEDLVAPLAVDLVPLDRVDPLFQADAIDGHRIAATDGERADLWELGVLRMASELLPVQRANERDLYGRSTE